MSLLTVCRRGRGAAITISDDDDDDIMEVMDDEPVLPAKGPGSRGGRARATRAPRAARGGGGGGTPRNSVSWLYYIMFCYCSPYFLLEGIY